MSIIEGELSACALGLECGEKEREDREISDDCMYILLKFKEHILKIRNSIF